MVVAIGTMKQPIHMPTHMRSKVVLQTQFNKVISLLLLLLGVQDQTLHGQSFTMVGEFLQDQISGLDSPVKREVSNGEGCGKGQGCGYVKQECGKGIFLWVEVFFFFFFFLFFFFLKTNFLYCLAS